MTEIFRPKPASPADLLTRAANLIWQQGYNPAAPHDPGPGYSLSSALCAVTSCDPSGRHTDLCEELHRRVAGYLYLTGQATAGRPYLPDTVDSWEAHSPGEGRPTQQAAAGVLALAASALDVADEQLREAPKATS